MAKHAFTVAAEKGATSHQIVVDFPTYDEATEPQRRRMFDEARSSVTIKAQTILRPRIKKGLRGQGLNDAAQAHVNGVLNGVSNRGGTRVVEVKPRVDATEFLAGFDLKDKAMLKLARAQIDLLTAKGNEVFNIPAELAGK